LLVNAISSRSLEGDVSSTPKPPPHEEEDEEEEEEEGICFFDSRSQNFLDP
jgi:hypothetical protein